MILPTIEPADLEALSDLAQDLSFVDAERRTVLLENATRDIHAAPGSGKTTILAAKLLLLARKWPNARRGVCVLSHTNVAREEIQRRLSQTADGSRLLAYPHFIGTIHGFVNQFLALPLLRSYCIQIDVIDDDAFAKRALALAFRQPKLLYWMKKDSGVADMVSTLCFKGADLKLSCEKGALPSTAAPTHALLNDIKHRLMKEGIFRHRDMFAFAESLLCSTPQMSQLLSRRFPLVFIDEMQDTSWTQEELLNKLFDETVTVQRFGDVNQKILSNDEGAEKLTFPRAGYLSIRTSKRFGPTIAKSVSSVQMIGAPVIGERDDTHLPTLILYDEKRTHDVINKFGELVLENFTDAELAGATVRALCARKGGDGKVAPGRHLVDYWPNFAQELHLSSARQDCFWVLLAEKKRTVGGAATLSERASDIRRALLLVLRAAQVPFISDVREGRQLLRRIDDYGLPIISVRRLIRDLSVSSGLSDSIEARAQVPALFFKALAGLLPDDISLEEFAALPVFAEPELPPTADTESRTCVVEHRSRRLEVHIGTVASMKGETHLASLVLESYGGQSRRHDLKEALPILADLHDLDPNMSKLLQGQFRNLYVAMSRPTQFLCLASNRARVSEECLVKLTAMGWPIHILS